MATPKSPVGKKKKKITKNWHVFEGIRVVFTEEVTVEKELQGWASFQRQSWGTCVKPWGSARRENVAQGMCA